MARNTYALRFVQSRKHWVDFGDRARNKSSLRGLDRFTFEAWVKVGAGATSPNQRAYVETQTGDESKIRFSCAPTRENSRSILRFEVARADGSTPTPYTFHLPQAWDDRWHHVAFSADIGNRKYCLYYDGVNVQKGTFSGGGKQTVENTEKNLRMGGDTDGAGNTDKYIPKAINIGANTTASKSVIYWDGKIDNVRIWNDFKNSQTLGTDIFKSIDDYATNTSLIEEWRFDEGPGTNGTNAVTRGTKDSECTATLRKSESESTELWIGFNTQKDFPADEKKKYGALPHDYDRPFVGDGLTDITPPTTPTNLTHFDVTETSFRIKWSPAKDNVYVQRYEVDVATDTGFSSLLDGFSSRSVGRSTEVPVVGLQPGATYYYRVRAVDSSSLSNTSPWTTSTALRPYTTTPSTRINYAVNPSIEATDLTGWIAVSGAGQLPDLTREQYTNSPSDKPESTTSGLYGNYYIRATNERTGSGTDSGLAHVFPWSPKKAFTASFWIRGTGQLKVLAIPRKDYVTLVDTGEETTPLKLHVTDSSSTNTVINLNENTWRRVWLKTTPTTANLDTIELRLLNSGGNGQAFDFQVDGLLIEAGSTLRDYFDGETSESAYWVTAPRENKGYVLTPATEQAFGFIYASPSALNIDVGNERGVRTLETYDRVEPGTPVITGVVLTSEDTTPTSFRAQWRSPNTNYEDIAGYELQVGTTKNLGAATAILVPGFEKKRVGTTTSFIVDKLTPRTTYYYRVRAFDEVFNLSPWSDVVTVRTEAVPDTEPPAEVLLLDPVEVTWNSFVARWEPTHDNVGVAGYKFSLSVGSEDAFILRNIPVDKTVTSYAVTGLNSEQTYFYSVRAYDEAGNHTLGLQQDPTTRTYDPQTYKKVTTYKRLTEDGGDLNQDISLVSLAVIDESSAETVSHFDAAPVSNVVNLGDSEYTYTLTGSGKHLLVQVPLQGSYGEITRAELILHRVAPLSGLSSVTAVLRDQTETPTKFETFTAPNIAFLPAVQVTITALTLPSDHEQRHNLLFNPATVNWINRPPTNDLLTVVHEWETATLALDVRELMPSGIRTYGFLISVDQPVTIYSAATPVTELQPKLSLATNLLTALTLVDQSTTTSATTIYNVFPNPTLDTVESRIALRNASFSEATTAGWDARSVTTNTVFTFEALDRGADETGGCGQFTLSTNATPQNQFLGTWNASTNYPVLANGSGTIGDVYQVTTAGSHNFGTGSIAFLVGDYVLYDGAKWVRSDDDHRRSAYLINKTRFEVSTSYTYTLSAQVATSTLSLAPRLGLRWFREVTDSEPFQITYAPAWRPAQTNTWNARQLVATPPSGAVYAEVEIYPHPFIDNVTGTILFDDVVVTVDTGGAPIGVLPITSATITHNDDPTVLPFSKDVELDTTTLHAVFDQTGEGVRFVAPLPRNQAWLDQAAQSSTINLIENPSFESSFGIGAATQYAGINAAELTRTTVAAQTGSYSLAVATDADDQGVRLRSAAINTKWNTAFVGSFFARGVGSYEARLGVKYADENTVTYSDVVSFTATSEFKRVYSTATKFLGLSADADGIIEYLELEIVATSSSSQRLYIDSVQIEPALSHTAAPSEYCDGHQPGRKSFWWGVPNQSISYRNAFVGHFRVKTDDPDPTLQAELRLLYRNGQVAYSAPRTLSSLALREPSLLEKGPFADDTVGEAPDIDDWVSTQGAWTVTDTLTYDRMNQGIGKAVQVEIDAVATANTTVAHLQSQSTKFLVVGGQLVTVLGFAQTTSTNLKPFFELSFYNEDDEDALLTTTGAYPEALDANQWTPVRVQQAAPRGATHCQVSLKVYATGTTTGTQTVTFDALWGGYDRQEPQRAWAPMMSWPVPLLSSQSEPVTLELRVTSQTSRLLTCRFDAVTMQFGTTGYTAFHGSSLDGMSDWQREPFNSPSELSAQWLSARTYYVGDTDNSSDIRTYVKPSAWTQDTHSDEGVTRYQRLRKYVESILPPVIRWNELSNPSFELNIEGWEANSLSTLKMSPAYGSDMLTGERAVQLLVGGGDFSVWLRPVDFVPAQSQQLWTTVMHARALRAPRLQSTNQIGGELGLVFYDAQGQRIATNDSTTRVFDLTVGAPWQRIEVTATAPLGTAWVRCEITGGVQRGLQTGDLFEFDAMMLYRGANGRPYQDGSEDDALVIWEGVSHNSPTLFVVRDRADYDLRTVAFDEDGVAGLTDTLRSSVRTGSASARFIEMQFNQATTTIGDTYVEIVIPYRGNEEANAVFHAELRRATVSEWREADVRVNPLARTITVTRGGLGPQTSYLLKIVVASPGGFVRGAATHTYTFITAAKSALAGGTTDGTVSYGDLVLSGERSKYFWVTSHDSFSLPQRRMQIEQLPRMDGSIELQSYWDKKTITIEGGVWGETRADLDEHLKVLRAGLAEKKQKLRIDTLTQANTYYVATCSGLKVSEQAGQNITNLTWTATFECADPYLYSSEEAELTFKISTTGSQLAIEDLLRSDQEMTVSNLGTVNAQPEITIRANDSTNEYAVVLYNDTTGDRFLPKTTLKKNEYLVIDTATKSCKKQGGIAVDYLGSFLELHPGTNALRASIKNLNPQRHNLLENPSADDNFIRSGGPSLPGNAGSPFPNVYPTYSWKNTTYEFIQGVSVVQARTQTYGGSAYAAYVRCDGNYDPQGVVFRTPTGLAKAQGWVTQKPKARTFTATAAIRTDVVNRAWSLGACFIRVYYTDKSRDDLRSADGRVVNWVTVPVSERWSIVNFSAIVTSQTKEIDYIEVVLRSPTTNSAVSFYVDDVVLAETFSTNTDVRVNFTIDVVYRERFI